MRKQILCFVIVALASALLVNPLSGTFDHVPASTALYRAYDLGPVSLLVQGVVDFQPTDLQLLNDYGTLTTVAGRVAVLHSQMTDLQEIARLPFVSRIERSWPLTVYLDKSVPDIGANAVWDQVRDPVGRNVTGQGVIVGFVDTGIDISHPDFTFPNGSTKILYVWDQTLLGRPPAGFSYGYECNSKEIQAGRCPEKDTFGHGTHVAGIAAGSGQATGNYTGVAPDANIIFVKSGNQVCGGSSWTFDSAQILDGVNYITKKAAELGRRAVINLSLGGNIGGHDGSDPWEIALDEFVKQGTAIVVAAGNEAQDRSHIRGRFAQGTNVTFDVSAKEGTTDLAIDIWYSQQDEVAGTLETPGGKIYTIPTSTGDKTANYGNVTASANLGGSGNELYFEAKTPLRAEDWRVTLSPRMIRSNGVWDAWVDTISCNYPSATFVPGTGYEVDKNITIGIPATAHYVVAVGAYITKTSWKGMNGETFGSDSETGVIAPFSSLGPTRDGRVKPDIVAPGEFIASARSNATAKSNSDPDRFHRILAGTSMAAPHVAGVIALMFQYDPNLQATNLISILKESAHLDKNTGLITSGSPAWGFGKIDARTATGLFRVTLVSNGVPFGARIPLTIDNRNQLNVSSGTWLDLYFPQGTTHTVTLGETVPAGNTGKYQPVNGTFLLISDTHQTTYTAAQLLHLTVDHTGFLVANYAKSVAATPPQNLLSLPLAIIVFLVLGIAAAAVIFYRHQIRRKKGIAE